MALRVLGVDPGLTRCGVGIVDIAADRRATLVAVEVIRTSPDAELASRVRAIQLGVAALLDAHAPEAVALERVFAQHNVRTAMGTAQAGGVVALAAARRSIPVMFHTPSEVKAAVTGNGSADKKQVTAMITRILELDSAPKPADAADALALAVAHCWRAPMLARLAAAEAMAAAQKRRYEERLREQAAARKAGGQ